MPTVDYNIIGKYRSQLMGIAILNVLVLHSLGWTGFHHPAWAATALNTFGRLIFTEGFLFLSGYGLYYSLHKNSNLKVFFTKRVKRLLIPYWLMTLPFFMLWLLMGKYGMLGFAQRVSTLYFWFHGNYVGMWYISVSVLLYLCFPLIYTVLQRRRGGILLLLVTVAIISALFFLSPDYYDMTSIGIVKIPFFIMGAWVGKKSTEDGKLNVVWIAVLVLALAALYVKPVCEWLSLRESLFRIVGMIACCFALELTRRITPLQSFLKWVGQYTLEIYIFHLMFYCVLPDFDNGSMRAVLAIGIAFLLCVPVHRLTEMIANRIFPQKTTTKI